MRMHLPYILTAQSETREELLASKRVKLGQATYVLVSCRSKEKGKKKQPFPAIRQGCM